MLEQTAVADVERLVVDEQADDLAVGHVHDRLARLRIAETGLGVRKRPQLIERVQIGAGDAVRLAFVEVRPQTDVPVGEREHRLGLRRGRRDSGSLRARTTARPRTCAGRSCAVEQLREVGDDDVGTMLEQSVSPGPICPRRRRSRSRLLARPRRRRAHPRTPRRRPARRRAPRPPARNVSGDGLPLRCSRSATMPSITSSKRSSMPAARRMSWQFLLAETTARRMPASRAART